MSNNPPEIKVLKSLPWNKATATFYTTKRRLQSRKANYSVFQVEIDTKLEARLISNARKKIDASNQIIEYEFITADQDETLLTTEIEGTDFEGIIETIQAKSPPKKIADENELIGSWSYIARIDFPENEPLYIARKVSNFWTPKKVKNMASLLFKKKVLYDMEDKDYFRIDSKIDFFCHGGNIFICDKKAFESALNFREGMLNNRDNIVTAFKSTNVFQNPDKISELVGDNMKLLRKLSQVNNSAYWKNSDFIKEMQRISRIEKWTINFDQNSQVLVTEDTIETILTVLNNDRLKSQINKEGFDVDVKRKIP